MSTRQQRRAQQHGSGGGSPQKKDPMKAIYIGFGIALILVMIGFGLFNFKQQRDAAAMYATPTPGPNASSKPIQIVDMKPIGKIVFREGNMAGGGTGAPVDGIACQTTEQVALHVHTHLALFANGQQIAIPKFIGIVPDGKGGGCLYWLHTHGPEGLIHIEAPELADYTLGNFFHIWGASLSRRAVGTFNGPVTAYINGSLYDGDLASIPLKAHEQITLEVGTPLVPPPNYAFPAAE